MKVKCLSTGDNAHSNSRRSRLRTFERKAQHPGKRAAATVGNPGGFGERRREENGKSAGSGTSLFTPKFSLKPSAFSSFLRSASLTFGPLLVTRGNLSFAPRVSPVSLSPRIALQSWQDSFYLRRYPDARRLPLPISSRLSPSLHIPLRLNKLLGNRWIKNPIATPSPSLRVYPFRSLLLPPSVVQRPRLTSHAP